MTLDQRDATKPPAEAPRWIDEELRVAVRELRMTLLHKATDTVPAASKAWTEAAAMVVAIMQQYSIPFEDPVSGEIDITPALIERLLDEAELSPGEITPGARAMLTILRWLYARAPEVEPQLPFDSWVERAAALYDRDESMVYRGELSHSQAVIAPDTPKAASEERTAPPRSTRPNPRG